MNNGTFTAEWMAVVKELASDSRPDMIAPNITAKVVLFDRGGSDTVVSIPIAAIHQNLDFGVRYAVRCEIIPLADDEPMTWNTKNEGKS